ncbi:hypothetical protein GGR57DRAFT_483581 [Xylariaceae sp. FL1272]|nr:hypothetical protein GGR57DRAFT_483581 [Xylariaceae sp. FL1272]
MSIWLGMKDKEVGNWKPFQPTNWLEINPHQIKTCEHIGDPRLCTSCFRPCRSQVSEADEIARRRAATDPSQIIAGQYFDGPIRATWDINMWADQSLPRSIPSRFPVALPNAVRRQFATPVRDGPTASNTATEEPIQTRQGIAANAQRARVMRSRGQSRARLSAPTVQNGAVNKNRSLGRDGGGVGFRLHGQSSSAGDEVEGKQISSTRQVSRPSTSPNPQYTPAYNLDQTLLPNIDTESRDMMALFQAHIPEPRAAHSLIPTNAPSVHSGFKRETPEPQSSADQAIDFNLSDWVHYEDVSEPDPSHNACSNIYQSTTEMRHQQY